MPVAIPFIALGATLLGTAVTTLGAIQQSKFKANIAKMNQQINEDNAERAVNRGRIEAQDEAFRAQEILGAQLSEQAASGLSTRSGSFALARKSEEELARRNTLNIVQASELERFGFLTDAAVNRVERKLAKKAGKQAIVSGALSAVSSIAGSTAFGQSAIGSAATTRKGS